MRSLWFALLVACGGGSKSSPPPISNQAEPAKQETSAMVDDKVPCEDTTPQCALRVLQHFTDRMCSCKDKACAEATNNAVTAWGTEMVNRVRPEDRRSPEMAKKSADIMSGYAECMTKLIDVGAPSDPCGGDPCGGP